jgi:hypothetical protein
MSAFPSVGGGAGDAGGDPSDRSPGSAGSHLSPFEEVIIDEGGERSQSAFTALMTPTTVNRGSAFLNTLGNSAAAAINIMGSGPFSTASANEQLDYNADISNARAMESQLQGTPIYAVNRGIAASGAFQEGTSQPSTQVVFGQELNYGGLGEKCLLCYTGDGPSLDICGGVVRSTSGLARVCVQINGSPPPWDS